MKASEMLVIVELIKDYVPVIQKVIPLIETVGSDIKPY